MKNNKHYVLYIGQDRTDLYLLLDLGLYIYIFDLYKNLWGSKIENWDNDLFCNSKRINEINTALDHLFELLSSHNSKSNFQDPDKNYKQDSLCRSGFLKDIHKELSHVRLVKLLKQYPEGLVRLK